MGARSPFLAEVEGLGAKVMGVVTGVADLSSKNNHRTLETSRLWGQGHLEV